MNVKKGKHGKEDYIFMMLTMTTNKPLHLLGKWIYLRNNTSKNFYHHNQRTRNMVAFKFIWIHLRRMIKLGAQ